MQLLIKHIQLFKFISKTKESPSIATYDLKEFDTVTIDHYLIKAVMIFKGIHKTFDFIPTEQTKDIEKLLQVNTSLHIEKSSVNGLIKYLDTVVKQNGK